MYRKCLTWLKITDENAEESTSSNLKTVRGTKLKKYSGGYSWSVQLSGWSKVSLESTTWNDKNSRKVIVCFSTSSSSNLNIFLFTKICVGFSAKATILFRPIQFIVWTRFSAAKYSSSCSHYNSIWNDRSHLHNQPILWCEQKIGRKPEPVSWL